MRLRLRREEGGEPEQLDEGEASRGETRGGRRKGEEDGKMVKVEGKKEQELAERKVERDRRQGGL